MTMEEKMEENSEARETAAGGGHAADTAESAPGKAKKPGESKGGAWRVAGIAALAVAFAAIIGGVGASIYLADKSNAELAARLDEVTAQNAKLTQFVDDERERQARELEQESAYQEDGYKVMDEYEIRSTTNISDAYIKGDPSGLEGEDRETYDMAKGILDEIIKDGMTDYDKELAIYNWMTDNIGQGASHMISMPGQNAQAFTPYEVLTSRTAVCVGYATTFRMLANMEGMEVHIVHNDYHSWDMVKLDDGEWYHVDTYSDSSGNGGAKYRNFNMTDDMARRTSHDWDASSLPEANGTKYSYAVQNAKEVKDLFSIPKKLRKAMDGKGASMFFKFPQKLTDKDMALADTMMNLVQQAMWSIPGSDSKTLTPYWVPDGEDGYVLAVYLMDYAQQDGAQQGEADPEKVAEMTDKINGLFGTQLANPYADPNAGPGADADPDGGSAEVIPEAGDTMPGVIGGADAPAVEVVAGSAQ